MKIITLATLLLSLFTLPAFAENDTLLLAEMGSFGRTGNTYTASVNCAVGPMRQLVLQREGFDSNRKNLWIDYIDVHYQDGTTENLHGERFGGIEWGMSVGRRGLELNLNNHHSCIESLTVRASTSGYKTGFGYSLLIYGHQ